VKATDGKSDGIDFSAKALRIVSIVRQKRLDRVVADLGDPLEHGLERREEAHGIKRTGKLEPGHRGAF
jgi:hypothetical protein